MKIESIHLHNFRNFEVMKIEGMGNVVFFTGENGSGKTNILESISVASQIKSFRNADDSDIIQWHCDSLYVSVKDEKENTYEVGYSKKGEKIKKKIKINGTHLTKASDFYSRLITVFFAPDDMMLIKGTPEIKRRYMDSVIAKMDSDYITLLGTFKKVLSSRNYLLKEIKENRKKEKDLDVWDEILAEKSSRITEKREKEIFTFSRHFRQSYETISCMGEIPDFLYRPSLRSTDKEEVLQNLQRNRKRDISAGTTLVGPHRDNYVFQREDKDISSYGSQGQIRIAAVSLKNAERRMIEEIKKDKAVLIIDDIFSELDEKRRKKLICELSEGNQVILSMVNIEEEAKNWFPDISVYEVKKGEINKYL